MTISHSVAKNLASTIKQSNKSIKMFIDKIPKYQNNLILTPITIREIRKIINKVRNKSSSGHNNITNILLKKISLKHNISLALYI